MNRAACVFAVLLLLIATHSARSQNSATVLPPILIGPYDGSDVADNLVVWSWFMQPSTTGGVRILCELRVVEILEGQTAEEALSNNPPLIVRNDLTATAWQTNAAVRSFQPGHHYAWRITAFANGVLASESEIWRFTYNTPVPMSADSAAGGNAASGHTLPTPDTAPKIEAEPSPPPPPETQVETAPGTPSPVKFGGRSRLTVETADRRGVLSEAPARFARLELDPRIEIFNAPFEFSALVTTERNVKRSSINRGAFNFKNSSRDLRVVIQQRLEQRIEEIQEARRDTARDSLRAFVLLDSASFDLNIEALQRLESLDPVSNIETLRGLGILSATDEVLLNLPEMGFGKVAPRYSELFFNNVTINGGSFEYNPGNLLFGATLGKLQREVDLGGFALEPLQKDSSIGEPEFFRNVYGGRIGYGRRNGSNIVLSTLYADDDAQSRFIAQLLDSAATRLAPQENFVTGVSGRLRFDSLGLLFDGELNVSLFNDNTFGEEGLNRVTSLHLERIFGRNNLRANSLADLTYALRGSWQFDRRNARIFGGVRMVGPGYRSVGVAGLRSDVIRYDGGYEHLLRDRTLRLNAVAGRELTGFVQRQATQSLIDRFGASADLRLRGLPTVGLSYNVNVQKLTLSGDSARQYTRVDQFGLASSYGWRVGAERCISNLSVNVQKGNSADSTALFTSTIFAVGTRVAFSFPLSLFVSLSQAHTVTHEDRAAPPVRSGDISVTYLPHPAWSGTAGVRGNIEKTRSTLGIFIEAQADIENVLTLQLHLERSAFTNTLDPSKNFSENIARFVASVKLDP